MMTDLTLLDEFGGNPYFANITKPDDSGEIVAVTEIESDPCELLEYLVRMAHFSSYPTTLLPR